MRTILRRNLMNMQFVKKSIGGIVALALCAVVQSHAQPFGGGGFFNGGAQVRQGAQSSSTYNPAGSIGNAQITIDPDTHNLILNADEETTKAMMQIIKSMDHPQPQVLIKVVFLEVTHNNSLDFGLEGNTTAEQRVWPGDQLSDELQRHHELLVDRRRGKFELCERHLDCADPTTAAERMHIGINNFFGLANTPGSRGNL